MLTGPAGMNNIGGNAYTNASGGAPGGAMSSYQGYSM